MKKILKVFSFVILPLITLVTFIDIGRINERLIYEREGSHLTMSGGITLIAWTLRGMCAMLLIIALSYLLYSKLSKKTKVIVFLLILIINLPLMYIMEFAIFFPAGLLIIPIVNLLIFLPAFGKLKAYKK